MNLKDLDTGLMNFLSSKFEGLRVFYSNPAFVEDVDMPCIVFHRYDIRLSEVNNAESYKYIPTGQVVTGDLLNSEPITGYDSVYLIPNTRYLDIYYEINLFANKLSDDAVYSLNMIKLFNQGYSLTFTVNDEVYSMKVVTPYVVGDIIRPYSKIYRKFVRAVVPAVPIEFDVSDGFLRKTIYKPALTGQTI